MERRVGGKGGREGGREGRERRKRGKGGWEGREGREGGKGGDAKTLSLNQGQNINQITCKKKHFTKRFNCSGGNQSLSFAPIFATTGQEDTGI